MKNYRVFILADNVLFANGLESLLKREEGVEVVGVARLSQEALGWIRSRRPDVIIVEANEGGRQWDLALSELLRENPSGRVICLSLKDHEAVVYVSDRVVVTGGKDLMKALKLP